MLRLTGGLYRGRTLMTPPQDRTRPTQAKLRQALFNSLQAHIENVRVLDLFAGSGALGFEALSRGAREVVFVESSRLVARLIEKNAFSLNLQNQVQVLGESVDSAKKSLLSIGPFDLVLADPPYAQGWEMKLVTEWPWSELLVLDGFFCLEWGLKKSVISDLPDRVPFLAKVREKNYGDSVLTTYQRCSDEKSDLSRFV